MHKNLINSISDEEFSAIVTGSSSINEVARKLGFKDSPGLNSRMKINSRIENLKLRLGSPVEKTKDIPERFVLSESVGASKLKGDISELSVQLELLENGVKISKPIGDNCPYDLIMDYNSRLYKIQVKTASLRSSGSVVASLKSSIIGKGKKYENRRYSKEEVDIFAVHSPEYKSNCYIFNDGQMSSISFRPQDFVRQKTENAIENFSLQRLLESMRLEP